tara:strand:+ start:368 stop:469 length:102 start_codon:yes stop_codon:yes gene_type:complete
MGRQCLFKVRAKLLVNLKKAKFRQMEDEEFLEV